MGTETELCMFEVLFFPSKCAHKKFYPFRECMLLKYTPKITDLLMFFSLMNPHKSSLAIITSNKENDWGAEQQESYLPLLPLFVHVMGECCRGEMKYHVISSRIPPPLSSHPALIFVCRSKRTSVRLLVQRMSEHPPFLKIGCAERGLKIDLPPH